MSKPSSYQNITDTIVNAIEDGQAKGDDWLMPWHTSAAKPLTRPTNAKTDKPYRGGNVIALWAAGMNADHQSGTWATYKQWQDLGAQVSKGEKGSLIVFYKSVEVATKGAEDPETRLFARSSRVFNADQVEGYEIQPADRPNEAEAVEAAEKLALASGAEIEHGHNQACYIPSRDRVHMPDRETFRSTQHSSATESYYSTLFHELAHWTGNKSRLDRDMKGRFDKNAYAAEELVAELAGAFLCVETGISQSPRLDHAQYVAHWLEIMKNDPRAIMTAAKKAEEAIEFLQIRA